MATYGNVNINYTLGEIKGFISCVERAKAAMADAVGDIEKTYRAVLKSIAEKKRAVNENIEKCKEQSDKMRTAAEQMDRNYDECGRRCDKWDGEIKSLKEQMKQYDPVPDALKDALSNAYAEYKKYENARTVAYDCLTRLRRIGREIEEDITALKRSLSDLDSAESDVHSAYSAFQNEYSIAMYKAGDLIGSAKKAYGCGERIIDIESDLSGENLDSGCRVAFKSVSRIEGAAADISESVAALGGVGRHASNSNEKYAEMLSDPVMDEIIAINAESCAEFEKVARQCEKIAGRLQTLAENLKRYMQCRL